MFLTYFHKIDGQFLFYLELRFFKFPETAHDLVFNIIAKLSKIGLFSAKMYYFSRTPSHKPHKVGK